MDNFIIGEYIDINDDIRLSWIRRQLEDAIYNEGEAHPQLMFAEVDFDLSSYNEFVYAVDENLGD